MAGADDDVLIKIAADIGSAVTTLDSLVESFKEMAAGLKTVGESSVGTSDLMVDLLAVMEKTTTSSGKAMEAMGAQMTAAMDAVGEALAETKEQSALLVKALAAVEKAAEKGAEQAKKYAASTKTAAEESVQAVGGITKLKEAWADLQKQQADNAASLAKLTQVEKTEIAELATALLKAGASFTAVADAAGLTSEALKELLKQEREMAEATEAAKGPLQRLGEYEQELADQRTKAAEEYAELGLKERKDLLDKIEAMDKVGVSMKEMSEATGLSTEALKELIAEGAKLKKDLDDARGPVDRLKSALKDLATQQKEDSEKFQQYSEEEKKRIAELVAQMMLKKQSLEQIADVLKVTTPALEGLIAAEKIYIDACIDANTESQGFFKSLLEGFTGTTAAAVTWGTIAAHAIEAFAGEVREAIQAFPAMIQGMADVGDDLSTMANRLNITAEAVAELKYIAGQSGASMEQMARSIQTFGAEAADAGSKTAKGLRAMNIELKDLGDTKEEQFFALIKKIQELPEGVDKSAKAIEIFGSKFRNSTMLLNEPIDQLRSRFKELGGLEGVGALAKAGDEWNDAVADLQVSMDSFKRGIATSVLEPLTSVVKMMGTEVPGAVLVMGQSFASVAQSMLPMIASLIAMNGPEKGLKGLLDTIKGVGGHLRDFGKDAVAVGDNFQKMGEKAGGAKGIFTAFGEILTKGMGGLKTFAMSLYTTAAAFAKVTWEVIKNTAAMLVNPYVLAAVAIAALLYGIYKLIGGWEGLVAAFNAVKKAMEPLITFFGNLLGIVKYLAIDGIGKLSKGIADSIQWFQSWWASATEGEGILTKIVKVIGYIVAAIALLSPAGPILLLIWKYWDDIASAAEKAWNKIKEVAGGIAKAAQDKYDILNETAKKEAILVAQDYARRRAAVAAEEAANQARLGAMAKFMAEEKRLNGLVKSMDPVMKANIKTLLEHNSAQEIATRLAATMNLTVDEATKVIERYDKVLKDAAKETKKSPFQQLQVSAKELTQELKAALASAVPFKNTVEEFGKQAADIAEKAALYGSLKTISPEILKIADAFHAAEIKEKLKEINKEALQVSRTFSSDMKASALSAAASIKGMNDEITASFLTGSDLRLFQIKKEEDAKAAAIANEKTQIQAKVNANILAAEEIAAKERKVQEDNKAAGKAVNAQVLADIEQRKDMSILAANLMMMNADETAKHQIAKAQEVADLKRKMEAKNTGNFELDMRLYGVITQKAADEQVKIEKDKLDRLAAEAKNHPYLKSQVDQQAVVLEGALMAADAFEKTMKAMGVVTERSAQHQLQVERKKLADMKALQLPWMASQIKAQEAIVDAAEKSASAQEKKLKELGIVSKSVSQKRVDDEKAKLAELVALNDPYYAEQIRKQKEVVDQAEVANGKLKVSWTGALSSITEAFAQLAQISGGTFGGMMKSIGEVAGGLNVMSKSFGKEGLGKMWKEAGGIGGMKGIGKSFEGMGQGFTKSLGGLMKGMGTIMPMAGAIISGVTAAIGIGKKLWDGFTESKGEKAAKDVGKRFGVTITEEMGDAIAKSAKDMFKGDQLAGEIYNLDKIIQAAGGVTAKNFDKLAGNLAETFDLVKKGKMSAEQAQEVLGKNFGAFADHVLKSGKIASDAFQKIVAQNAASGVQSKEVLEFVVGQTARLGTALSKMGGPFDKVAKLTDDLAKAQDKIKEGAIATPEQQAEIDKLTAKLKEAKGALGDTAVAMGRFERLAVAGFNAAIKSGASYLDAMEAMGPALDTIVKAHKALGTTAGPAIEELLRFREVAEGNKELVESAASLNEVMLALSNIGGLTADTMKDLQEQGHDTFASLQAAGFSEKQSLQQMKGFLEQVRTAHKQMGLPIDENTQKMIDQAEQQGILAKEQISTNEVLREGLSAVIEALGGKIPDAFRKMAAASKAAAAETKASFVDTAAGAEDGVKKAEQACIDLENSMANMAAAGSADWLKYQEANAAYRAELEKTGGSLHGLESTAKVAEQAVAQLNQAGYDTAAEGTKEWAIYQQAVARWKDTMTDAGKAAVESTNDVSGAVDGVVGKLHEGDWELWAKHAVEMAETVGTGLDDTVNMALDGTTTKIKETPWAGFAAKGVAAGTVTKNALGGVDRSVDAVATSLDNTDWAGWSDAAVDAAREAQEAVDGVSLGHSPGGLKEIPIKLFEAMRAFKQWERQGVISASAVEEAVNGVQGGQVAVSRMTNTVSGGRRAVVETRAAQDARETNTMHKMMDLVAELKKDAAGGQPLNVSITTIDAQNMEQAVESKILPAIEKAIRNNRRQTRSNLRQVLGVKGVGE